MSLLKFDFVLYSIVSLKDCVLVYGSMKEDDS